MYIKITSRCNMKCAHCCDSCTEKGTDMSSKTFLTACKLAEQYGFDICIGGGEPTVHPKFWEFLGLAIGFSSACGERVGIITNGKNTESALRLARLAKDGIVCAELSLDIFHEPIKIEVRKAFENSGRTNDLGGIRTTGKNQVVNVGRAKSSNIGKAKNCMCPDIFVETNGDVFPCSCKKRKLGNVYSLLKTELSYSDLREGQNCKGANR